jgi:hypothetical protein
MIHDMLGTAFDRNAGKEALLRSRVLHVSSGSDRLTSAGVVGASWK